MSRISKDDVQHVAHLSRLTFTEEEIEKFTTQLDEIIGLAEQLNEVNTANVKPTSHVLNMKNVMREDVAEPGLPREELLRNVPDQKDGQIRVPSIIE